MKKRILIYNHDSGVDRQRLQGLHEGKKDKIAMTRKFYIHFNILSCPLCSLGWKTRINAFKRINVRINGNGVNDRIVPKPKVHWRISTFTSVVCHNTGASRLLPVASRRIPCMQGTNWYQTKQYHHRRRYYHHRYDD